MNIGSIYGDYIKIALGMAMIVAAILKRDPAKPNQQPNVRQETQS